MSRRGVTLLELLAALVILGILAVAAAGWLRLAGRAAHAAGTQAREWSVEAAAVRLLRDDLRLGRAAALDREGLVLTTTTLHTLDRPGRRTVRWWVEGTGRRRAGGGGGEGGRVVVTALPSHRFHRDDAGDLWWLLDIEPGAEPTTAARRHLVWSSVW